MRNVGPPEHEANSFGPSNDLKRGSQKVKPSKMLRGVVIWVWLKIKELGLRRSLLLSTKVPFTSSHMGLSFFGVLSCFKRQKVGPPRFIPPNHTPESYPESYPRIIPLKTYAARC